MKSYNVSITLEVQAEDEEDAKKIATDASHLITLFVTTFDENTMSTIVEGLNRVTVIKPGEIAVETPESIEDERDAQNDRNIAAKQANSDMGQDE